MIHVCLQMSQMTAHDSHLHIRMQMDLVTTNVLYSMFIKFDNLYCCLIRVGLVIKVGEGAITSGNMVEGSLWHLYDNET